jgi:hypothetical protein
MKIIQLNYRQSESPINIVKHDKDRTTVWISTKYKHLTNDVVFEILLQCNPFEYHKCEILANDSFYEQSEYNGDEIYKKLKAIYQ